MIRPAPISAASRAGGLGAGWLVSLAAHAALIAGGAWLFGSSAPPAAPPIAVEIVVTDESAPAGDAASGKRAIVEPAADADKRPPPKPALNSVGAGLRPAPTAAAFRGAGAARPVSGDREESSPDRDKVRPLAAAQVATAEAHAVPAPATAPPPPRPRPEPPLVTAPPPRPKPRAPAIAVADLVDDLDAAKAPANRPRLRSQPKDVGAGLRPAPTAVNWRAAASVPPGAARGAANPAPGYPQIARENGWEGRVVLAVTVAPDGSAREVRVKRSSRYRVLDAAALDAVRDWRFTPARRLGRPVAGTIDVPITFRLTDQD